MIDNYSKALELIEKLKEHYRKFMHLLAIDDRSFELMKDDGFDASKDFVRVGVKSGGCSGLSYELKFDKKQQENDTIFENNDIKIIVNKKSFLYLVGTTLDYSGGLNGTGFVFKNPNANRTCGCGESFSL